MSILRKIKLLSKDNNDATWTDDYQKTALDVKELDSVIWDRAETTFPSSTQELYTYKRNGVTVMTVLVTYQTAAKNTIILMQKTRV